MGRDDGGSAFPLQELWLTDDEGNRYNQMPGSEGMSLRDYFAAKALVGVLASEAHPLLVLLPAGDEPTLPYVDRLAINVYHIADAMLAERQK